MSGFWIFVIFATIIASVAKNNADAAKKAAKGAPTPSTKPQTPQDLRELLEKQIKEILEGQQQRPAASQSQPRKIAPATQVAQVEQQPLQSRQQKSYSQIKHNPSTRKASAQQPSLKVEVLPKSEFEAIIDDFTIEKAVIYSEILEPKFKQY